MPGGGDKWAIQPNGTLALWGYDHYGQGTPTAAIFVEVSAGRFHICTLWANGLWTCCGKADEGQVHGCRVGVPLALRAY